MTHFEKISFLADLTFKDVLVILITFFIADDLIFFSEDHKGAFIYKQ